MTTLAAHTTTHRCALSFTKVQDVDTAAKLLTDSTAFLLCTVGKLLHLPESLYPHLYKGCVNASHMIWRGLSECHNTYHWVPIPWKARCKQQGSFFTRYRSSACSFNATIKAYQGAIQWKPKWMRSTCSFFGKLVRIRESHLSICSLAQWASRNRSQASTPVSVSQCSVPMEELVQTNPWQKRPHHSDSYLTSQLSNKILKVWDLGDRGLGFCVPRRGQL